MIDVVWPGAFAPYLVDLKPKLGKEAKQHAQGIIQNDTIDGKLVAMPWFGDFGILYYRTDLLKKYGYTAPPKTWTQLFAMAKKIQDGEQAAERELLRLRLPGQLVRGPDLRRARVVRSRPGPAVHRQRQGDDQQPEGRGDPRPVRAAQIGKITPRDVTTYQEGEAHTAFVEGNAAFMRNWPYAYSIGADPKRRRSSASSASPCCRTRPGTSVGTVGGWQLAVNKYSKHVDASIEFVRYMTSAAVAEVRRHHQHERADDPRGREGPGRREGEPVPEARDRQRHACHAAGARPQDALQRGLARPSTRGSTRSSTAGRRAACCRRSQSKLNRILR